MEKCRSAFKILTDKPTGKRPIGRSRPRWEDNIKMVPMQETMLIWLKIRTTEESF